MLICPCNPHVLESRKRVSDRRFSVRSTHYERGIRMKSHSLKTDLKILELGPEYFPRFSKDTTDEQVAEIMSRLKQKVREQRELLVKKSQEEGATSEEKIREIQAAAERILEL